MNDFEDYPELTGDIEENFYTLGSTPSEIFNKKELYYKKIYKDIYDDEIINYDQNKYIRCAMNITDSINIGEFSSIITKIQDLLTFKEKYHRDKYYQIETPLMEMIDSSSDDTSIYTDDDGNRHILFQPELERQSNWPYEVYEYPITILFANIRSHIRSQYSCRSSMMDILYKKLKYTNNVLLKIELANRNVNIVNNAKFKALFVMTQVFRVDQIKSVKQMTIIDAEMNKLNYCTIVRGGDKIERIQHKWIPPIH
jgi:hypothetical protein